MIEKYRYSKLLIKNIYIWGRDDEDKKDKRMINFNVFS